MSGEWIRDLPMAAYLAEREYYNGSALSLVEREPEKFGEWVAGRLVDVPTDAKARGTWAHARLQGLSAAEAGVVFPPTRAEFCEPVWELTDGGNPKKVKGKKVPNLGDDGKQVMAPQDASPRGEHKSMLRNSDFAKAGYAKFLEDNAGKSVVSGTSQGMVNAMVRAVHNHAEAAALLKRGPGVEVELTGRWTCRETGQRYQIRPDVARLEEGVLVEIKTITAPGEHRLDTLRPRSVLGWAAAGFARKSAMLQDGGCEIEGKPPQLWWIIVEATDDHPRVSVIGDTADSLMARSGREGCFEYGITGYHTLAKTAYNMRRKGDFRPLCVRGTYQWNFPQYFEKAMEGR
jgi:hypothetical protein